MTDTTKNYQLYKPDFNQVTWHGEVNDNFDNIDAIVYSLTGVTGFVGAWTNSTVYTVGLRVTDTADGTMWQCLVAHTSPGSGTMADYRASNPTHWQLVSAFPNSRGAWAATTYYAVGDLVYDLTNTVVAVCIEAHTSQASISDDAAKWQYVVDMSTALAAAQAAAVSAAASASAAATSEAGAAASKAAIDAKITVSTDDPSGGVDGDIWFKVPA